MTIHPRLSRQLCYSFDCCIYENIYLGGQLFVAGAPRLAGKGGVAAEWTAGIESVCCSSVCKTICLLLFFLFSLSLSLLTCLTFHLLDCMQVNFVYTATAGHKIIGFNVMDDSSTVDKSSQGSGGYIEYCLCVSNNCFISVFINFHYPCVQLF